jgi:5'(3')-deoxyribonucleotidase
MPTIDFERIWHDQMNFNAMLRDLPKDYATRSAFTKEMVLHMMSELDELLRTSVWKSHRKQSNRYNAAHTLEELVDLFKFWLTTLQAWGFTAEDFEASYWRKSAVVRQRYNEEWLNDGTKPVAVVDIDNVLCDYITGMCQYVASRTDDVVILKRVAHLNLSRSWVSSAALGLPEVIWQELKHDFRVAGLKRTLPVMPGAKEFLDRIKAAGMDIVLLTSRPIDRYPNVYTDTLAWLQTNDLPYDFIWWSTDKHERLLESGHQRIAFAVDDDLKFVAQLARLDIPVVWLYTGPVTSIEDVDAKLRTAVRDVIRPRVTWASSLTVIQPGRDFQSLHREG